MSTGGTVRAVTTHRLLEMKQRGEKIAMLTAYDYSMARILDAAGIDVAKVRFGAVMVSGALSGLAGMCFAYSISANFSGNIYVGYGYLSIAALIFGNWKIVPTLAACLLFGFAKSGGYQIVQAAGMPSSYSDLVMILPYVVTLLLLVFFSKHNRAPRALGEIYDKGKR
jgi:simple sugar transport system permease protein